MKRDATGKFVNTWDSEIKQRVNVTLTKTAWQLLNEEAQKFGISRSEVIERVARNFRDSQQLELDDLGQQQIEQLTQQLTQEKAARQQAEERLQLILTSAQMVAWDMDLRLNRVVCSPNALEVWGIQEGTGEDFFAIIHPDDRQQVMQAAEQAISGESTYFQEYRVIGPDGVTRWLNSRGRVYLDNTGRGIRIIGISVDVTERKQTESKLQENQRFIQHVADAMPGTLYVYDMLERRNIYVNRHTGELLGYTPAQIESFGDQLFPQLIHPDDVASLKLQVERLNQAQEGEVIDYEYRIRHANGEWRWLWSRNTASTRTPDGLAHQVVGTVHDITARKRAEAGLQQREQRFSTLFDGMEDWVLVYHLMPDNRPGPFIEVNEQACKQLGYSREELLTMSVADILGSPTISPKGNVENLLVNKHIVVESMHATKDGRRIPVEVSATLFTLNGLPTVQSICRDITERRAALLERQRTEAALAESNQTLQAIIQACPLAIMGLRADGTVRIWNPAAERIFGWSPLEVLGKFLPAIPPDKRDEFSNNLALTLHGQGLTGIETQRQKKGNILFDVELWAAPVDETQAGISCLSVVADITDRKQAEAEREQLLKREQTAREQAEVANRIKDEFLAVLSHELRTPLNPILGWTRLLRTRQFDVAATDRALETIERNAKLQAQLIEDLLDVSRILQGKVGLNAYSINLVTTIEAALETVRLSAEAKGIQIQMKLNSKVGPVHGDANRLQQIIWNLLSNAVKFTPAGGRVEVRLESVRIENGELRMENGESSQFSILNSQFSAYAQIQVSDTGQGISPDFLPYVFEYFRQADSSSTRHFGGLGLGLAIVRHLVELHGGTIKAASPGLGMGATFTVQLPLMTAALMPTPEEMPPQDTKNLRGIQILIVDDEADMRDLLSFILQEQGATVLVAASATEALQQLAESVPDVLISDIGMPETNGYALIRQIRAKLLQQGRMMPAIALTAYAGEVNQQQALAAGFQLHLAKPIEPEQLLKTIAQVVSPFQPS